MNSLFLTDLYKDRKLLNAEGKLGTKGGGGSHHYCRALTHMLLFKERINQTVEIVKHTVDIEEKGVKLKLTIVDTPGFGDAVNNTEW